VSTLPPIEHLPKPTHPAATRYNESKTLLDELHAQLGGVDNLNAQQRAEDDDRLGMLEALDAGQDPVSVGTPNEMARRARVHALRKAVEAKSRDFGHVELALGRVMIEHRDEALAAARKAMPPAAAKYARAVDAMLAARVVYEDALQFQIYAATISTRQPVPNYSAGNQSSLVVDRFGTRIDPDTLRRALVDDATRHEQADRDEAERVRRAAQEARGLAEQKAASDQMRRGLEGMDSHTRDPQTAA